MLHPRSLEDTVVIARWRIGKKDQRGNAFSSQLLVMVIKIISLLNFSIAWLNAYGILHILNINRTLCSLTLENWIMIWQFFFARQIGQTVIIGLTYCRYKINKIFFWKLILIQKSIYKFRRLCVRMFAISSFNYQQIFIKFRFPESIYMKLPRFRMK